MSKQLTITVLGTGTSQGVPVIGCSCEVCQSNDGRDKRLRVSIAVSSGGPAVIVDIGPDFRQQLLREDLDDVAAVLITHEHNDHISGLDDIRPINFKHRKDITMYTLPRVIDELKLRYRYVFDPASDYPGRPRVLLKPIDENTTMEIAGVPIESIGVMHGTLPILGFRFGDFCYITDAKDIVDKELEKMKGLDTLIINALHHRQHFSHLNLEEALVMVEKINPRMAYFTHVSHDMGLAAVINDQLPENVMLAYDGLQLTVPVGKGSLYV